MSTYGNELRIVRNRWAHGDEFTTFEAMRAVDTVFIVLNHIGDMERAEQALAERALLVSALTAEPLAADASDDLEEEADEVIEDASDDSTGDSEDTPQQFVRRRTEFEPWDVVVTGSVETLDNLPKKLAKESVRATIEEIVDSEGPIHRDRLTKLVGYTYGLGKVHAARSKKIVGQIKASSCEIDKDQFVWAGDIDPAEWKIYRRSPKGSWRKFLEISPREIANAAADVLQQGDLTDDELRKKTLAVFGRSKNSQAFIAHFNKGLLAATQCELIRYAPETATYVVNQ